MSTIFLFIPDRNASCPSKRRSNSSAAATIQIHPHKSYIASLKAIKYLEGNEVSVGPKKLPVGKVYREQLLQKTTLNSS